MGANYRIKCPVEGCEYVGGFRLTGGEETDPVAYGERVEVLRAEHPEHPKSK